MPRPAALPRRLRRITGRLLIAAGLIGTVVFIGSIFYDAGYSTGNQTLYLQNGCAIYASFPAELGDTGRNWPRNPYLNRNISEPIYWLKFEFRKRLPSKIPIFQSTVPIWTIPVFLLPPGIALLVSGNHARRWLRLGRCVRCGYDLRSAVAGAPCPECGASR